MVPSFDPAVKVEEPSLTDGQPTERPPIPYTEAELNRLAQVIRCDRDELRWRWIIQHETAYYVLRLDGSYHAPITIKPLEPAIRRDLAAAPIEWTAPTSSGGVRQRKLTEILRDHVTVARHVQVHLDLARSWYDPGTQTFHEAVCPPRTDIVPVEDHEVAEWLEVFAGDAHNVLLDWMATVRKLSEPTAALVIQGGPGVGKSCFAVGMSRLWSRQSGPAPADAAWGRFTDALTQNPIVHADESIPQDKSAELRRFVGTREVPLTRKFLPSAKLIGCPRLVITANHNPLVFGREDFDPTDINAIACRFLYIKPAPRAASLLQKFLRDDPGRMGGWPERIARYALHLEQTREVTPGTRFLVEGHASELAQSLATRGGPREFVGEWICRLLAAKPDEFDTVTKKDGIRVGNGKILLNAAAVVDQWRRFINCDFAMPRLAAVGEALRGLTRYGAQVKVDYQARRVLCWSVDPDIIIARAKVLGIGDEVEMRKRIDRRLPRQRPQVGAAALAA